MALSTNQRRARLASYVPLQITARLRCGVISDGFLPIDAALYYAAHRDALAGTPIITRSRERVGAEDARIVDTLPLKRIQTTPIAGAALPSFYYAASAAQWPETVADGVDYWTTRIDTQYLDLMDVPRARVPIAGGPYRGYRMPMAYRHALSVSWYVVGEATQLRYLLSLVTHVGKKTGMGWGSVIDWTVAPHAEDWSVSGPDGRLMRPVPEADGLLYGIRPPYWLPRHQVPCRLPEATPSRRPQR